MDNQHRLLVEDFEEMEMVDIADMVIELQAQLDDENYKFVRKAEDFHRSIDEFRYSLIDSREVAPQHRNSVNDIADRLQAILEKDDE